ncbi:glycosyltransferase family 4 protein [Thermovorax subterraneus]|nr:glycosyltransferase family 4 protein [Thermovorax subterraneus]
MKEKVLIMTGYYIPSVKGGGPIQSIKNLVDKLSDRIDFYIVTSDRDLGDKEPFKNIQIDTWTKVGNAKVFYTDVKKLSWKKIIDLINNIDFDVLYLNSFFSYKFSIIPVILRKIKKIPEKRIIIAPRGEFSKGALGFKKLKKQLFIAFSKITGLHSDVVWHATTELEKCDIKQIFGEKIEIIVANNLAAGHDIIEYEKKITKKEGELKIVFVSRIHPKKNLKKAIELVKNVEGKIEFNIYGPIEDTKYWMKCLQVINELPSNIKVEYKGVATHDKIIDIFREHHVFLFPTLGENFGHVIIEALIGGCPVIISDQTPWINLEAVHAGWDIPLDNEKKYIEVIQYCVDLGNEEYKFLSKKAFTLGMKISNDEKEIDNYCKLFLL